MIHDNQMGKFSEQSYSLYQALPRKCRESDDVYPVQCVNLLPRNDTHG